MSGQAVPTLRVEPCVLSNDVLWQQDGGEPIVYTVFDQNNGIHHVALSEYDAEQWIACYGPYLDTYDTEEEA